MLETLLSQNEGKIIEFKESSKALNGIIKTVIAFANTAGGTIVIGVRDGSKELIGVPDVLIEEERLVNAITDSIAPSILPDVEIQTFRGKEFLIIHVPHSIGPYYLKSEGPDRGVYIRFGSTNRIADKEMLSSLRLLAKNLSYDELPCSKGELDDSIIKTVFNRLSKRPNTQMLESLGIITRHVGKLCPTNGGVLLFGSNRVSCFPDSIIRCARFSGTKKEHILDQIDIEVALPFAVDHVISFIERNIRKGAKIGRMYREDILEYPPIAIREAVINAILHADYSMSGCHIKIAIFDDRIEFSNPGGLPFGLTIEKAIAGSSKLRNRVIGRIFRELKLIEQWGSGLQKIIESCKHQGLKTPIIEDLNNQFQLTLYSSQVEKIVIESWGRDILRHLEKKEAVSTKEAAKLWKVSTRTARLRLKKLQESGFILRVGTSENDPKVTYIPTRKFF